MKNKIILLIFVISLIFANNSFASNNIDPKLENKYNHIINKLNKKYDIDSKEDILKWLNKKIEIILSRKNLEAKKVKLLNDISKLINETLYDLYIEKNKLKEREAIEKQKILERQYISNFKKDILEVSIPKYIKDISSNNKKILILNEKSEFIDWNDIKKIKFNKFYLLDKNSYNFFKWKKWIIVFLERIKKFVFIKDYKIERKIPYSESWNFLTLLSYDNNVIKEGNSFYSYDIEESFIINDKYWFYLTWLKDIWIDKNIDLIHRNSLWKYSFVKNNKKIYLIDEKIIFWVSEKEKFLKNVKNDKAYLTQGTNDSFLKLKNTTEKLTFWLTREEKIKRIYWWILDNIEYSKISNLNNKKIHSGIHTYINKNWVCEWYVKLMSYMLSFAGIYDVKVIRWAVIDAQDFPEVWHAWLKIWDLYYDPTFDDAIWLEETRKYEEYIYFWLPKDLFYTNRYNLNLTPKELKTTSLEYRKLLVSQNLLKLVDKYKRNGYLILNESIFRKKYWIWAKDKITVNKILEFFPYYEIHKGRTKINWKNKIISKISYFEINDKNINLILLQLNYNMDWMYIFKWFNNDWTYKYIISNKITFN